MAPYPLYGNLSNKPAVNPAVQRSADTMFERNGIGQPRRLARRTGLSLTVAALSLQLQPK